MKENVEEKFTLQKLLDDGMIAEEHFHYFVDEEDGEQLAAEELEVRDSEEREVHPKHKEGDYLVQYQKTWL
jgi:hypothetical protein